MSGCRHDVPSLVNAAAAAAFLRCGPQVRASGRDPRERIAVSRVHNPRKEYPMPNSSRRTWLKLTAGAVLAAPMMSLSSRASASQNAASRQALKYQDKPSGSNQCSNCMHFVPGKTAKDLGACKVIPGDTEISPNAWCVAWAKKA
jgi:hypothetical protein